MGTDWFNEPISTTEWLAPCIEKDSIFHAIQHLGLQKMNVIQLNKHSDTKRPIHGLIVVSTKPVKLLDQTTFNFDDEKLFGGKSYVPGMTQAEEEHQKLFFSTSTVTNCDMTVNLVNYALMASTKFGERCGPFLKRYFTRDMEQNIKTGRTMLPSIIPIAFAHNYTAKLHPKSKIDKTHVTYFANYHNRHTCDPNDDLLLYVDPSGELKEFHLSSCGIQHIVHEMELAGATRIYAIVEDDSKGLVEEVVALKKESYGEGIDSLLNTSSIDMSASSFTGGLFLDETNEDFTMNPLSDVSEIAAESDNFLDAMDFDLIVEDAHGQRDESFKSLNATVESVASHESDEKFQRYRQLVKEITAAKKELGKLWFHGMEDYNMLLHPEFEAFCSAYHIALRSDDRETRIITSIEDGAPLEKNLTPSRKRISTESTGDQGPSTRLDTSDPSRQARKHVESISSESDQSENVKTPKLVRRKRRGRQDDDVVAKSPRLSKRKILTTK